MHLSVLALKYIVFSDWLAPSSMAVSYLIAPLIIGICRRKSTRLTAVTGGFVTALGCLFTSFASQFHQLFFSYGAMIGSHFRTTPDCFWPELFTPTFPFSTFRVGSGNDQISCHSNGWPVFQATKRSGGNCVGVEQRTRSLSDVIFRHNVNQVCNGDLQLSA